MPRSAHARWVEVRQVSVQTQSVPAVDSSEVAGYPAYRWRRQKCQYIHGCKYMIYPEIRTILYATDMGDHMRPVFRFALGMAKRYEARIIMLHAAEPLSAGVKFAINAYMPEVNAKEVLRDGMKKALEQIQQRLDEFCEEELKETPEDRGLVSEVKVVSGRPAETITQEAEQLGADLIVVGTHTDPSFGAHLIGSTARRVTQISRTPVMVIPVYE